MSRDPYCVARGNVSVSEAERKKILLRLVVPEDEIFTCVACGRRFFIDRSMAHDSQVIDRAKVDPWFRRSQCCGECHAERFFWRGERYLDEG